MSAGAGLVVTGATLRIGTATLLDGVSFGVGRGLCAILGPNGAGKTTLMHFILGLLPHAAGGASFGGADLRAMPADERARRVAFVEHAARTDLPITAREVVMLGRIPHQGAWRAASSDVDSAVTDGALAMTGLGRLGGRLYQTLSGGEQQRVQIARALAQEPALLLLDEPTSHLDLRAQLAALSLLRTQASAGLTILAAIHDLSLAAAFFDHVVVMKSGRAVAEGDPRDVLTGELIRDVYEVSAELISDPRTGRRLVSPDIGVATW